MAHWRSEMLSVFLCVVIQALGVGSTLSLAFVLSVDLGRGPRRPASSIKKAQDMVIYPYARHARSHFKARMLCGSTNRQEDREK